MSQPPPYNRLANFTTYALAHPAAPYNPSDHDAELNAIETTVDALCTNLALIQRDDGEIANETIGIDQLETELRALIAISDEATVEPWTTGHSYKPGDAVSFGVDAYLCVVAHVATTFSLDLAAGYWVLIGIDAISTVANAALIAFTPVGTISSTNVQAAVAEVATDAAAATAAVAASSLTVAAAAATYIPLTQKAAPLGVATLDAAGIVLSSQLPASGGPFISLGEKGIANGVATLDAGVKVPVAQLPDLSGTYIPIAQKAAANGVASLDAGTLVPVAQLPPFVGKTAATGAAVMPAGTTAQRPGAPAAGYERWNSDLSRQEIWNGSAWLAVQTGGDTARNAIINGDMRISQRGTTFPAAPSGFCTLDRWLTVNGSAAVFTINQLVGAPAAGLSHSLQVSVTTPDAAVAAGDICAISQRIEGYSFLGIAQRPLVLSFYVNAPKAGTYCVSLQNGGSDRYYIAEYTVNAPFTWERKTILIPQTPVGGTWNYTNGFGLSVSFVLMSGSTYHGVANAWTVGALWATANQVNALDAVNSFYFAGVDLRAGTDAPTLFEAREIATELTMCFRYFERIFPAAAPNSAFGVGIALSAAGMYINLPYSVVKRALPTLTINNQTAFGMNGSATTVVATGGQHTERNAVIAANAPAAAMTIGQAYNLTNLGGTASIDLSAEI